MTRRNARPLIYPGTDVFLLFFALTHKRGLDNCLAKWAPEVRHHLPDVPIVMVGSMDDMRHAAPQPHDRREQWVSYEEGIAVANQIGAAAYLEISSLYVNPPPHLHFIKRIPTDGGTTPLPQGVYKAPPPSVCPHPPPPLSRLVALYLVVYADMCSCNPDDVVEMVPTFGSV